MKKYIFLFLSVLLLGAASCRKNFMDRFPQTSVPPDLFFKSENDLSIYINGLVSLPGRANYVSDQNTDDKATTGVQEIIAMMTGTPTSQTITTGWSWSRLRNINYFLQNYDRAEVTQEVKNHYAGLARYYRAEFYIDKVKRYSDVPWYSRAMNPSDTGDLYKQRDARTLVIDSIMADLEFASANVRESVPAGTPGKWVVKLVYARTALYEGTYRKYHPELNLANTANGFLQKAAQVANEVIVSNKFAIHNTGNPTTDYGTLFNSATLTGNKEVLLSNMYDQDLGRNGGNQNVINNYEQSPSRDLVQTYLMKDGTRFTEQPGYQTFGYVQEFQNRDPRLSQTLFSPGIRVAPATIPYVLRFNKNFTGYHQLKGYINSTDTKTINSVDFPSYRYAEVLLTYAEALAELGTITQADLDKSVNLLRARAGVPSMNLATANGSPDPVLAAKHPNVSGANKGAILEIRREKRVEFAAEGYRFDDLMRWGAGKVLETAPEGMYFPGLGTYDVTGDGVPDIGLIDKNTPLPSPNPSAGIFYYKAGCFGENVTIYLKNCTSGTIVTDNKPRQFIDPKYYYRPIPYNQAVLNPKLKQNFGWD